jgi:hypothetical protein
MRALFASFRSNTRANVAVISAVSALPRSSPPSAVWSTIRLRR